MKINTKTIAILGMLAALSIVLVMTLRIPFPPATFLEYDPADIPILIGTFIFGPFAGLFLTIVVSLIQGFTVSVQSGPLGVIMHIAATGSFVIVTGLIYGKKKTILRAIIGLITGIITMTVVMVILNLWLDPIFWGIPYEAVLKMIVPIIIPFNLLKAGINAFVTFFAYQGIKKVLLKFHING